MAWVTGEGTNFTPSGTNDKQLCLPVIVVFVEITISTKDNDHTILTY
jgi:hypothetical protein